MFDSFFPTSDLTPERVMALLQRRWRFLAKIVVPFALVGVAYALLLAPTEYKTEASLMPEFQARSAANLKRFGALADLVGIDLESVSTTEAVRPDLYPDILTSTPFLLTVMNQPVTTTAQKTYPTLVAFLEAANNPLTAWLDSGPLMMPKPDSLGNSVRLTREQEDLLKDLRERIVSDLDKQSGLIMIRVKMPDAEVAAQVCQYAIGYLKRYVVEYRTGKTRKDLVFMAKSRHEAKGRSTQALQALSVYTDQNRFVYTQSARIEGKRLEADYNLVQGLYDELSRQYEQTRIKLQEQTPVLTVLEPPKVSSRRSEPRRMLTVLTFAVVGLVIGLGCVFGKPLIGLSVAASA